MLDVINNQIERDLLEIQQQEERLKIIDSKNSENVNLLNNFNENLTNPATNQTQSLASLIREFEKIDIKYKLCFSSTIKRKLTSRATKQQNQFYMERQVIVDKIIDLQKRNPSIKIENPVLKECIDKRKKELATASRNTTACLF